MQELKLNKEKTTKKIVDFLKKEFKKKNKKNAILALSGGIDSALCAYLLKKAGLNLYAVILPYKNGGSEGIKVAESLKLPKSHIFDINIGPMVDVAVKEISTAIKIDKFDEGNIMARQRMIVQYAIAKQLNGLVVGTENLSEYYLGYFTLHGDQACDISPISCLWKTQVRELSEHLSVPQWVIDRAPTAGLWQNQTDEGELGFTYKEADQILHLLFDKKYPKIKIIKQGFSEKTVNKVLGRVKATDYKRQDVPKT